MSKIYAEVGKEPVWLSPTVGIEVLKMVQNFSITLRKGAELDSEDLNGPGDVPCIILRDFSKIVAKNDFESAELSGSVDSKWSIQWYDDDLSFTYADGTPFEDGIYEYNFVWKNFYTLITPGKEKKETISIEAYGIPGCTDGTQSELTVQFAYPAYITSLKPDMDKSTGVVQIDEKNNKCIVSQHSKITLSWTGVADFTDDVILREDGTKIAGSFSINDSYCIENIMRDIKYELTVTNSYLFSYVCSFCLQKTNWHNRGAEQGVFQNDVYSDLNYRSQIFSYENEYYVYIHPSLYKRDADGTWNKIAENDLYDNNYICYASYLYAGVLYIAGNINGSKIFSFCNYDINTKKWTEDPGIVQLSTLGELSRICCGFAISQDTAYFYRVNSAYISINQWEDPLGWGGGQFYFNAPNDTTLTGGTVGFHVNQFYVALLCKENQGSGNEYAYLYDCNDESEKYLMKLPIANESGTAMLLDTSNNLWIATDHELINCDKKQVENSFYPSVPKNSCAWLGSDGNRILGVFPDKNLWTYEE